MDIHAQDLPFDPATLDGLSEALLRSHHQRHYIDVVEQLNAIRHRWSGLDHGHTSDLLLNGLKQEELVATNAMLPHELYFGSMGGAGAAMAPGMALALAANFGSVQRWQDEFVAMGKALGGGSGWVLLDVRRAGVYAQSPNTLPGARWADPVAVDDWARDLPTEEEILVYCVYGHEVGRATALRLRAAGIKARFLLGGIDGWAKAGKPLASKTVAP